MEKVKSWFRKPCYLDKIKLDPVLGKNSQCKGVALIVSNNYEGSATPLPSSDEDSNKMEILFSTLKNYEVVTLKNLKCAEFLDTCKRLASLPYPKTYKRIVIYFAGHGGDGFIAMVDGGVRIEDIQAIFDPNKHPNLCTMARIFFIDACRGSTPYSDQTSARGGSDGGTAHMTYEPHCRHRNELIAYGTLKGYIAYDDQDGYGGTWTQKLYMCLAHADNVCKDLGQVLTLVNGKLDSCQTSTYHSSLSESIFFWKESGMYVFVSQCVITC